MPRPWAAAARDTGARVAARYDPRAGRDGQLAGPSGWQRGTGIRPKAVPAATASLLARAAGTRGGPGGSPPRASTVTAAQPRARHPGDVHDCHEEARPAGATGRVGPWTPSERGTRRARRGKAQDRHHGGGACARTAQRADERPRTRKSQEESGRARRGTAMRVLVIEDDGELADAIGVGLRRERLAVDVALDGQAGLERALVTDYDVIVLDRDLPGLHGDDVCAGLVEARSRSRVLMLTAAARIEDRVDGLGLGADDYLPKPFAFAELVARIRALLRRAQPGLPPVLVHGDLALAPSRRPASRGGHQLDLGPKEFGVLELLLAAQGPVLSAEEILERGVDEMPDPFTSAVKVTMSRLRRKLGDPPVIETVAQAGYRI